MLLPAVSLCVVALHSGSHVLHSQMIPEQPVEDFSLHGFDQENGWLLWRLTGRKAEYKSTEHILVHGMVLTSYHGDESQRNPLTIASPLAEMFPREGRASGNSPIRVLGSGYSIEGADWSWNAPSRTLEIRAQVVVLFDDSLNNLLR